MHLLMIR